jgi:hypothetical protein
MKIDTSIQVIIAVLFSLSLCVNCGGWVNNRAVMKEAPEESDLAPDLVRDNIDTTDYSAIVYKLKGRVKEAPGRRGKGGYVNHIYRARVLETIKGPRYDSITFTVMAERDIRLILPDHPVIVSLCGKGGDVLYIPDNGYELPATPVMKQTARDHARMSKGSAPLKSICSE